MGLDLRWLHGVEDLLSIAGAYSEALDATLTFDIGGIASPIQLTILVNVGPSILLRRVFSASKC